MHERSLGLMQLECKYYVMITPSWNIYASSTSINLHMLKYINKCAIGKIIFEDCLWYITPNETGADLKENINNILLNSSYKMENESWDRSKWECAECNELQKWTPVQVSDDSSYSFARNKNHNIITSYSHPYMQRKELASLKGPWYFSFRLKLFVSLCLRIVFHSTQSQYQNHINYSNYSYKEKTS